LGVVHKDQDLPIGSPRRQSMLQTSQHWETSISQKSGFEETNYSPYHYKKTSLVCLWRQNSYHDVLASLRRGKLPVGFFGLDGLSSTVTSSRCFRDKWRQFI